VARAAHVGQAARPKHDAIGQKWPIVESCFGIKNLQRVLTTGPDQRGRNAL
jgi:hypothetical protein